MEEYSSVSSLTFSLVGVGGSQGHLMPCVTGKAKEETSDPGCCLCSQGVDRDSRAGS
jgi:hypothetical protein